MISDSIPKKADGQNKCPTALMLGYFLYDHDERVQGYVKFLTRAGYAVDVLCLGRGGERSSALNKKAVRIFPLRDRKEGGRQRAGYLWEILVFFTLALHRAALLHRKNHYQFIHVHNVPDFLVYAAWLPKIFGAKIILDIHDILPEFYARKFSMPMDSLACKALLLIERLSCRLADHVIIANDIWKDRIRNRSAQKKQCTAIVNYPDRDLFTPQDGSGPQGGKGCFTLIYHGSYTEHHGVDIAIRAVDILRRRIGPFRLLLYGRGSYEPELRNLAESLGLMNWIEFRKPVSLEQVPQILGNADVGVVPKRDGLFVGEAISTKLFQYVAMRVPVVVSRTVGEKQYFNEEEVKFFEPGNVEDLAQRIQELYEDPQGRAERAQRGYRKMEEYSAAANEKKYLELIYSLV